MRYTQTIESVESIPKVSIIIPVYNGEEHLAQCLCSIHRLPFAEWECLVISDGADDYTDEICNAFAGSDHRIKGFRKRNGGVSSARNLGLDKACGEWVAFVDADDEVMPQLFYQFPTDQEIGLLVGGYHTFGSKYREIRPPSTVLESPADSVRLSDLFPIQHLLHAPWGMLFRRSVIEQYHLRFNEEMRLGEDSSFNYSFISHCSKIQLTGAISYMYRVDGHSRYQMSASEYEIHIKSMMNAIRNISNNGHWGG